MDITYFGLIALTMIIGLGASAYVNGKIKKYSRVAISNGLTGEQAARQMLAYHGITNVQIRRGGAGQDFFDPRTNTVTLSPQSYDGRSITATATACHEVGHACQYANNYAPMKVRGAIVPVANLASNAWVFVLMIGFLMNMLLPVLIAIALYAFVVIFQLVTLPVEFNASRRAMAYMGSIGLSKKEQSASFDVLRACALTYVAAALTSVLQFLWLLGQARD